MPGTPRSQRERLAGLIREMEEESGPIEPAMMDAVREAWPGPKPPYLARDEATKLPEEAQDQLAAQPLPELAPSRTRTHPCCRR